MKKLFDEMLTLGFNRVIDFNDPSGLVQADRSAA
jgi:hypothetical protein